MAVGEQQRAGEAVRQESGDISAATVSWQAAMLAYPWYRWRAGGNLTSLSDSRARGERVGVFQSERS